MVHDGGDVGVGGADGYAEANSDLRPRVVPAKVNQVDKSTLVRRECTAAAATLTGDDGHGYPLDQRVRQVEYGR